MLFTPEAFRSKLSPDEQISESLMITAQYIPVFPVLHNADSSILCDVVPNLYTAELSVGQRPAPMEHSICHIAYDA